MKYYVMVILLISLISSCKVKQPVIDVTPEVTGLSDTTDTTGWNEIPVKNYKIYHGSRTRLMDLIHTKLDIHLDWDKQQLNGLASLQLRPYFKSQDKVVLDAKNFDIYQIALIKGTDRIDLNYYYNGLKIFINLDTMYSRTQDIFLEIKYTAKPTEREHQGSRAIESDQGLYFINPDKSEENKPVEVWTQGETESSSCWFPTIDSPNERTTQEMFITVPDRYTTLSNGELVYSKFNGDSTRTDYWKMDLPHAPYLFMLAVGEFQIYKDSWHDIPVTYYMEEKYAPYSKEIFGATPEMMSFFSDIFGVDFVWPKYAQIVVRDFVTGAMENTTATVFNEELNVNHRELIDYNFEEIIAHELSHHWFGDLVTCESWANLTLNEGFADYAEYLWDEYKYGTYEADLHGLDEYQQYMKESLVKQVDLIRFDYDDKENMFDNHSYAKGGLVLNMLRDYVGDDAFFESLKRYLEQYKFSSVEIHNLRLVFEEVIGEDLNWFFNQWYLASGHPVLQVEDTYSDTTVTITISQLQDLGTTPLYKLPVTVEVYTDLDVESYDLNIDKVSQTFELPVHGIPQLVLFDASQKLLAEIRHPKSLEEYVFQFFNTEKFLSKYHALDTLLNCNDDSLKSYIIRAALKDKFWYFRQMAVNQVEDLGEEYQDNFNDIILDIARNEPKSSVKADALHILRSLTGDKYVDVYKQALGDSSYMVAGSAVYIYSTLRPKEFRSIAGSFEDQNNVNIVIPLASYYIDAAIPDKYNWFVEKLKNMPSDGLWYMLQYFGEYMMNAPELTQRKSIAILENYARYHHKIYVRLAAYQALGLLSELSGVENLLEDIKNSEHDEYLRQLYQSIL